MRSLGARVTLAASAVLAVFVLLTALVLEHAFRESTRAAREERLLAQVFLLMAAAEVDEAGRLSMSEERLEPRFDQVGSGLYGAVSSAGGRVVWRSRSAHAVDVPFALDLAVGASGFAERRSPDGGGWFVQGYGVRWTADGGSHPLTFSAAEDLAPYHEQLRVYRQSLLGWLGVLALLLLAVQWLTLRWGLAPLRRIAADIASLESGDSAKLTGEYPREIRPLTENLNALLVRERARQRRYRDALADLAHSLKTPLALLRGAHADGSGGPDHDRSVTEQVARMDTLVDYHLQRAAASGPSSLLAPRPLRPAVERLLHALHKVHAARAVEVVIDMPAALQFRVDEGDLTEILGNVLDNAFKWCRREVRIAAGVDGDRLQLTVEDDGAGIAAEDSARVLERGVRADQALPGHGIGLAVTRDIVAAYDGDISIGRSPLGGAAITIRLPQGS